MVINKLAPFSWVDDPRIRIMLANFSEFDPDRKRNRFDPERLHNQKIKHHLIEIYKTHRDIIISSLSRYVYSRPIPSASLQMDLWTSKLVGAKFFGKYLSFSTYTYMNTSIS